jgi:hypothetical protein
VKTPDPQPLSVEVTAESLRLPDTPAPVLAKLKELLAAYASHDQGRIDLVLAEISGLAAREQRAEDARSATGEPGPEITRRRIHQPMQKSRGAAS